MDKSIETRANQKIREEIYEAIGEESGIDVHVREGVVGLTGVVDTEGSLDFIESRVREVENELRVKIVH